jgi:hypothetical protein
MQKTISGFYLFFKIVLILIFGYFFWLMLRLTLEYIPAQSDVSFLMIKQTEVNTHTEYLYFFYAHVYTSIFVLFSGFIAVFVKPKAAFRNLHRFFGKIYVILLLLIAAPSGIYMGFYANGGILAKISFVILGILWWFTTYKAYLEIRKKNVLNHKKWMYRSYALAVSAITLRLWKVVLVYFFQPNPMDVYEIIAWLGWVPNLILTEILIKTKMIK